MTSVTVLYHRDPDGSWWADSPGVDGWSATADSVDVLRQLVEEGVRFTLERDDVRVDHKLESVRADQWLTFDFVLGQATGPVVVEAHTAARA